MEKPQSNQIADMFGKLFSKNASYDIEECRSGEPIFVENDVYTTGEILDQALRRLFVDRNITYDYFEEKFKTYGINIRGWSAKKTNNNKANMLKQIKKGGISFKVFDKCVRGILSTKIDRLTFDFTDNKGDKHSVALGNVFENQDDDDFND